MANYLYIARTSKGEKLSGVIEAGSEAAALAMLDERQLYPVRVVEQETNQTGGFTRTVKARDLGVMYEQLADLLRAGVPMLRALQTLARTNTNARLRAILEQIAADVAEGEALADAMARQPQVFNELQNAMVRAGERGGFLEDVLADMSVYLERQDELRAKVRGAMIYPALLTIVGIFAVGICLIWLVPKFQPLFKNMPLPLPSRVLFALSDALVNQWLISLSVGVLVLIGLIGFMRTERGRSQWAWLQLKIPVVGNAILMVAITRFCRILGTMLASGVPILQALQISRDAIGCKPLAENVDEAIESVREGGGLSEPLSRTGLVPQQILEMIAVAEESNQLEKVLLKIADTVERRTNQSVDQAVRLLEPVILIMLSGAILFVAMGLLVPIFTMARTIR